MTKTILKNSNTVLIVFLFFVILIVGLCLFYYFGLTPSDSSIESVIGKYNIYDYSIPYYVAERYLIWLFIRNFFFLLNYLLTLLGIFSSLLTVFYASTGSKLIDQEENNPPPQKNTIIFLSLLSVCCTIASMFINPGLLANTYQHAWRQLDMCIIETINHTELPEEEKNIILTNKIMEIELYIESFEH